MRVLVVPAILLVALLRTLASASTARPSSATPPAVPDWSTCPSSRPPPNWPGPALAPYRGHPADTGLRTPAPGGSAVLMAALATAVLLTALARV